MKQVTVVTEDRVGVLADISYILGKARINIESLSAEVQGKKGIISIMVKDEAKATELLKKNGYEVLSSEVLVARLRDEPGTMAEFTSTVQKEKLSVASMYYISKENGMATIALTVDKPAKARRVLAHFLNGPI